jgi:YVTN family beta-propeller protein
MNTLRMLPLILATLLLGCVSDPVAVQPVVPTPSAKGVYILNEGLFGQGNSSLTYYDLTSFAVSNDVYAAVNGTQLGDVGNQVVLRGTTGYVVVNNSDKIEIFDDRDHRATGTIRLGSGTSPRQLAFVNDTTLLVTSLYLNSVLVVSVPRRMVIGSIPVGSNPEGIVISSGKAFVANSGFGSGRTVSVISLDGLQVTGTLGVGENPIGVVTAPGLHVYVMCNGGYGDYADPNDDTPARMFIIDPVRAAVVDSVLIGGHAGSMAIGEGPVAYVPTTDSVVTVDLRTHRRVGTFVRGAFYGVSVEDVSGDVYLTDIRGYTRTGRVVVYSARGEYRTQFDVGLIPGSMAFKR